MPKKESNNHYENFKLGNIEISTKPIVAIFLLLFTLPANVSKGCGPIPLNQGNYTFVNPELVTEVAEPAPFLLEFSFEGIYQSFGTEEHRQEQSNIKEWQNRVCQAAKIEDIRYVIYETDMNELLILQNAMRDSKAPLPSTLKNNDFAEYLLGLGCNETVDYLVFAKRCEPHVISYADLWEKPERNRDAMNMLIDEGKRNFRRTDSHYIRLRYAYQVIRLAHYLKEYQLTLDLYDFFLPKIDDRNSLIYYWLEGHHAGALRAMGKVVEASYIYTTIFKNCSNRRASAFQSFLIRSDEEWNACYLMCKDNEERAAMYAIRAGASKGRVLQEMENIYNIYPKSYFLELLLMKEIKQLEATFLGVSLGGAYPHQRIAQVVPKDKEATYLIELQKFARKCRQEKLVKNTTLWEVAEAYLEFLAGDYYKARKTLEVTRTHVMNENLKDQLNILYAILELAEINTINEQVEDDLLAISQKGNLIKKYPDFRRYFNDRVAMLYEQSGRPGLAFRAHYGLKDLGYNPDLEIVEDLLVSINNADESSRFERLLGQDTLGDDARAELINIKATYYMARGRWREANAIWEMTDRANWRKFGEFGPFAERFDECVHCDGSNERGIVLDTSGIYTKGRIVELILEKEADARLREEGAEYLIYQIGLALYNMSYFGHAWGATDFFRTGSSNVSWKMTAKNGVLSHWKAPYGNRENFDVSTALIYFEEARDLAFEREKFELAAKATFMAAKCQQKQYFATGSYRSRGYNQIPVLPIEYTTNFEFLNTLQFTDFYKRIIKECKYFEAYVR